MATEFVLVVEVQDDEPCTNAAPCADGQCPRCRYELGEAGE